MSTIRVEAARNANSVVNLDNFRSKYREVDEQNSITVFFPSYIFESIEKNYFLLLARSRKYTFNQRWDRRPDYTSSHFYNSPMFWPIILYINNIYSIEDYTGLDEVIIPPYSLIAQIARDKVSSTDVETIKESALPREIEYYKKYSYDEKERKQRRNQIFTDDQFEEPESVPDPEFIESEETFQIVQEHVDNKAVHLKYIPANTSSIYLIIDDINSPMQYGYDYVLILNDASEYRKISWDAERCPYGDGLETIIEEGTKVTIRYIYSSDQATEVGMDSLGRVVVDGSGDGNYVDGGTFT